MRRVLLIAIAAMVFMAGCAKMPGRYDYKVVENVPVVQPAEDEGVVCFLRESAFTGGAISYFINEDDKVVGMLKSGSYFMIPARAGKHTYWAETESKDFVTVDVEADKYSYVIGSVSMGFWAGRPDLEEVSEAVAKGLLPELDYTVMTSPDEAAAMRKEEKEKEEADRLKN